jgi:UDP-glucose 4-epimerase
MTVLVTGSAGHLGEALVRTLRVAGRPVIGLDRVASPFTDVVGSITDPAVVARCVDGASAVVHAATLHKPHIVSHTRQEFVDVNITGTLTLLDAATRAGVRAFIYTSTTSTFGAALEPAPGAPAAWIDETVVPIPKNIYGVTKVAAEDLCTLAYKNQRLPVLVLRTSRFFPEPDDDPAARDAFPDANLKLNELVYRRVDIEDVVDAHVCAIDRAEAIGFARYIISAATPLHRDDVDELRRDAPAVLRRRVPGWDEVYARLGYRMPQAITRVYDSSRACEELGWRPRHDFATAVARIASGGELRSALAKTIGIKGYHPDVTYPLGGC